MRRLSKSGAAWIAALGIVCATGLELMWMSLGHNGQSLLITFGVIGLLAGVPLGQLLSKKD